MRNLDLISLNNFVSALGAYYGEYGTLSFDFFFYINLQSFFFFNLQSFISFYFKTAFLQGKHLLYRKEPLAMLVCYMFMYFWF